MKNRKEFFEYIEKNKITVVKFTAKWCKPCKECQPFVEKCLKLLPHEVDFIEIDIDGDTGVDSYFNVQVVPSFCAFCYENPILVAEGSDKEVILRPIVHIFYFLLIEFQNVFRKAIKNVCFLRDFFDRN